jgi:LysM repeat protein
MKILNIFGLVVAVHIAVFLLIFAIPGCRASRTAEPIQVVGPEPGVSFAEPTISSSPSFTPVPELASADLNPALVDMPAGGGSRFSPTRPGTPVAQALTTAPVADVTPAQTYAVVRGDSLWSISKRNNISVRELAAANNLPTSAALKIDQKLIIPGQAAMPTAATASAETAATAGARYTIQPGDTLSRIASRNNTTVAALRAMNNLRSDTVRVGDSLVLPVTASGSADPAPVAGGSTVSVQLPTVAAPARAGTRTVTHTVAAGETLGGIARRYEVTVGAIALANSIADPTRIRPGQELAVPGAAASATTSPTMAPPAAATMPSFTQTLAPVEGDLDAGLDPTLSEVPVLDVVEPVRTIILPGPESDRGDGAPIFE